MIGVLLFGCKVEEIGGGGCPRDHAFVPQGTIENSGVAAEYLFYTVGEDIRCVSYVISAHVGEDGRIWEPSKNLREEDGSVVGDWYEIEFVDSRTLRVRIDDNPTEYLRVIDIAPDFCSNGPIPSCIFQRPKNLGEESENSNY